MSINGIHDIGACNKNETVNMKRQCFLNHSKSNLVIFIAFVLFGRFISRPTVGLYVHPRFVHCSLTYVFRASEQ